MKIEIKPLVRPIRLREYAEEYGDEAIWVWVNPPRRLRQEHQRIAEDFQAVMDERAALLKDLEQVAATAEETGVAPSEPDPDVVASLDQQITELSRRLYGVIAELWSQHDDAELHWTADDIEEMVEACSDADPPLWNWMQDELWRLILEHRQGIKKK